MAAKQRSPELTINQACAVFGVTPMSLGAWRRGSATRSPMPYKVQKGGRAVTIPVVKAMSWADKHGVPVVRAVDEVLADPVLAPKKSGPRACRSKPVMAPPIIFSRARRGTPPPLKGGGGPTPTGGPAPVTSDVLALANRLSPGERKKLADILLAGTLTEQNKSGRDVSLWTEAVRQALDKVFGPGAGGVLGPVVLQRALAASSSWQGVEHVLGKAGLLQATPAEKLSALQLLAHMLVMHVQSLSHATGVALSTKMLANCAQQLPGIFDTQFPGYLESGLAHLPFKARAHGKD